MFKYEDWGSEKTQYAAKQQTQLSESAAGAPLNMVNRWASDAEPVYVFLQVTRKYCCRRTAGTVVMHSCVHEGARDLVSNVRAISNTELSIILNISRTSLRKVIHNLFLEIRSPIQSWRWVHSLTDLDLTSGSVAQW